MNPVQWLRSGRESLTLYVFVIVLFVVGVVFGTLMYNALTLEQQEVLAGEVSHYAEVFKAGIMPEVDGSLRDRAIFYGKWLLLIWLLGITVVGLPVILALDFMKGVLIGFSVGALISQHEWKGLLFAMASIAPPNLIVIPALIMASVSGLTFSLYVIRQRLIGKGGDLVQPLLSHTAASLLLLLVLWGAALVEVYLSPYIIAWAAPYLV
ncbi:stage II sporulation protein M [Paenibacillus tarimensis]|uniref:stage II sporulation protein M n=1 Tax=Paenibacillus tarimensis TaxID=416012 RepID=UPI001F2D16F4|nr:stage II sporulation protein M [Paenibacillus tarimensis]MCF2942467.1 stage II sporulation protein M [Paenibacillus tarimensis]